MPREKVKIHYRRYSRSTEPPFKVPLSEAIAGALNTKIDGREITSDFALRKYEENDGTSCLLNGRLVTRENTVFGELVRYDPDSNITLIMQGKTGVSELEIREISKPNDADFLRGMSFFMLKGDHVLVIEQDLGTPLMERYFRWLLCQQSKVSPRDARVQLIPRIFLDPSSDLMKSISSIKLRPSPVSSADSMSEKLRVAVDGFSDVIGILRAAHFDTSIIEKLSAQEGAAVELKLDVTFKAGRKKLSLKSHEAIAMLRNVPEDDLIIDGEGVRNNRGHLERLTEEAYVEQKGNTLDRKGAWAALADAASAYGKHGLM